MDVRYNNKHGCHPIEQVDSDRNQSGVKLVQLFN